MVLASAKETDSLEVLAALADRIVEVAVPTVSNVKTSFLSSKVEHLCSEIASLKSLLQSLSSPKSPRHPPQ